MHNQTPLNWYSVSYESDLVRHNKTETYLDGEVGREGPGERVVLGGSFSRRALSSLEEHRAQLESAIDELGLIGIAGPGLEKPLKREVDGERRRVRELEKCVQKLIPVQLVKVWDSRVLGGAGSLGH